MWYDEKYKDGMSDITAFTLYSNDSNHMFTIKEINSSIVISIAIVV